MKSIMYHYIRDFDPKKPYFNYLNFKNFEKQIIYFKNKYKFFDCNDFSYFKGLKNLNKKIFLTFDDGLSCNYKYVFKILKKNKLNGIFYIPTLPYYKKKILNVHKVHLILGTIGEKKASEILSKYLTDEMLDKKKISEFKQLSYSKQSNSNLVNKFKRTINYYINYKYRNIAIEKIFLEVFGNNEKKICEEFYINEKQIKEMVNAGMVIGSHSVSHPLMTNLKKREFKKEIDQSFKFVNIFYKQKTFCYPFGGFLTFNSSIEKYLSLSNVVFSMNLESRNISIKDIMKRPQALPRYDCNEFIYGKIDKTKKN